LPASFIKRCIREPFLLKVSVGLPFEIPKVGRIGFPQRWKDSRENKVAAVRRPISGVLVALSFAQMLQHRLGGSGIGSLADNLLALMVTKGR